MTDLKHQRLDPTTVSTIQALFARGFSQRELADVFGISLSRVNGLCDMEQREAFKRKCLLEYGVLNVTTRT